MKKQHRCPKLDFDICGISTSRTFWQFGIFPHFSILIFSEKKCGNVVEDSKATKSAGKFKWPEFQHMNKIWNFIAVCNWRILRSSTFQRILTSHHENQMMSDLLHILSIKNQILTENTTSWFCNYSRAHCLQISQNVAF